MILKAGRFSFVYSACGACPRVQRQSAPPIPRKRFSSLAPGRKSVRPSLRRQPEDEPPFHLRAMMPAVAPKPSNVPKSLRWLPSLNHLRKHMITLYAVENGGLRKLDPRTGSTGGRFSHAAWIDLHEPSPDEEEAVEQELGVDIPTREEMREIEESSRIYVERSGLFMTGVVIVGIAERRPARSEVMFVVLPKHFVTVRYSDPLPFRTFEQKCARKPEEHQSSDVLFVSLVERIIQRAADVLEKVTADLDEVADELFDERRGAATNKEMQSHRIDLQGIVRQLGRSSGLLAKLSESLLSFNRILSFFRQSAEPWLHNEANDRAKSLQRDISSLSEYGANLTTQIGHL